ncbi:hypothetical protein [Sphingomonas glacialis]|uniref:Uncharacterized protein n=1 Tax=Sphingomonas glacialis TaxID=658225 RepID=A0A502FCP1_9SPHN|nr:hypothetical protein [Sphingomonas glacialis]TPG47160.1 hypothetical protein EAH76_22390 [Sphingomonas glacialis]
MKKQSRSAKKRKVRETRRLHAVGQPLTSLSSFKVLSRAFSNDPNNVLERSRPNHRTDGSAHIEVPLIDFGATGQRISAGGLRLQAAVASVEYTGSQLALRAIGAWYNVYGYRAPDLGGIAPEGFTASVDKLPSVRAAQASGA